MTDKLNLTCACGTKLKPGKTIVHYYGCPKCLAVYHVAALRKP